MVAATPPPIVQSWADHQHAWRASSSGVEATSDGGRHWRVVLKTPNVTWLTRTSPTVGIVESGEGVQLTKDAGRHWYAVSGFSAQSAIGRGNRLFAANGQELLQAEQWPPKRLRAGMTIPVRRLYRMDGNLVLRVKQLVSGGVIADVLDGSTPVQQLVYRDWLAYLQPVDTPQPLLTSWADRVHAWRGTSRGVEATSDGGAHWRVVFPLGVASGASVDVLIRTSARAGLASIAGRQWVTIDAGRHWYQATGGPTVPAFGRGTLLFGTGDTGIDQAVQWPPRRVACTGRWVHSAASFSSLSAGPRPRTICRQDRGVEIPMRRVWSVTPPDGESWIVYGRKLAGGELQADVVDMTSELSRYVGSVYYRNGVATTTGFSSR